MLMNYYCGLGKGDVFGDQFWKNQGVGQSAANVRALTYCDLHAIKRDKLLEVLAFYKAFALSFARNLTLTYNLRQRLVFRKVADVKREKELADRTKDEPQVATNQDHIVRKLFSKFRRQPTTLGSKESASQSDAEKGEPQTERAKVSTVWAHGFMTASGGGGLTPLAGRGTFISYVMYRFHSAECLAFYHRC